MGFTRSLDANNKAVVLEMCKSQEVRDPACEAVIDFKRVTMGAVQKWPSSFHYKRCFAPAICLEGISPFSLHSYSEKEVGRKKKVSECRMVQNLSAWPIKNSVQRANEDNNSETILMNISL
jgi:hypothetical protein